MSEDNVIHMNGHAEVPCDVEPPCEVGYQSPRQVMENLPEPKADSIKANTHSPAAQTLIKAAHLIDGARHTQHGNRHECHALAAQLWSVYLGSNVTPEQVAMCMTLLKIARTKFGEHNPDDYTDLCGYGALAGEHAGK